MATCLKNLSEYDEHEIPSAKKKRFGIVVSEWNSQVTSKLLEGSVNTLKKNGVSLKDIIVYRVPGAFELTYGAKHLANTNKVHAVICLGCVIQGETPHFTYICEGVSYGITHLNITYSIPFIFGVITANTLKQAIDRAGGKHGNKGIEAAITAIRMASLSGFNFSKKC